ncbi:alpha/beta fold hydrolase [Actinoplanes sp. RD1]|uniref:alpha/beta fold hydrolase n=1 Tax=Actinoplanes sp. RD1 TaxID=3064538 RepID=UPI00274236B3|nr:alpha/beta hydrolase [Actinoplanes sp. RD1]
MSTPAVQTANLPTGRGAVDGAPALPDGFGAVFRSRFVVVDGVRLHAVVGGQGPALLLLGGWPESWYAWRLLMPDLARRHTVVAVDPRGTGLSDKPAAGYDAASQAADMVGLMTALGHPSFDMAGHDIGMWTGYAVASDHPGAVRRLAVVDAIIPGVSPSPPLLGDRQLSDFLWHFNFNRTRSINEAMVRGREEVYIGHQFATKAATPDAIPPEVVGYYVESLRDPEALRASFDYYRAMDDTIVQNQQRIRHRLRIPVLTVAGGRSCGELTGNEMRTVADDVTSVVIDDCGHYVPEEAPGALLAALNDFLR